MAQITNHQSPISNRTATPFQMPMFREWVPKGIQPWIYIIQVLCIQFSCGVYLGAMEAVRGTTALQLAWRCGSRCCFGRSSASQTNNCSSHRRS